MARHQTRPLIIFLLALFGCVAAVAAQAHTVTATDAPSTAATDVVSGTVDALVVEDRVHNVTVTYPLLRQDDGTVVPLVGTQAGALTRGSRVGILGRWDRRQFEVAQSQTLAEPSAPVASPTIQVTGTLFIAHADDFASGLSQFLYEVHEDSSAVTALQLSALPTIVHGGMRISVSGPPGNAPHSLRPQAITILSDPSGPTGQASSFLEKAATINSVLIIMANFNDTAAPAFTQAQAQAVMTSNANSVSNYYKEVSYGQQLLNVTVTPWVTMNMASTSSSATSCSYSNIGTAANAAATAAGYNPSNYAFVGYLFPALGSCGWSGLAYVSFPKNFWINGPGSFFTLVVAHEMGHNFGLFHAGSLNCSPAVIGGSCSVAEYGDPWDTMGNQRAMHFNAIQKRGIGFIPFSTTTVHSSGTANYTLDPLENANGSLYSVIIGTANPSRTYFVEFRQPIGFDAPLSSYPNLGAEIRLVGPFEWSSGADDTEILDMTPGTGGTFTDSALMPGNTYNDATYGISITVNSATASALNVSVTKSSGAATTTTLVSSANPSNAGANVTLTATVTGNAPTGTVNFKDGGLSIGACSAIALSGAGNARTAACSTTSLTVGTHNVTAVYSGDGANAGSTSNTVSQVVNGASSTTTLATSLTPSTVGTNVTFTATVTATSPTGPVNFKDGASSIAGCSAVSLAGSGNTRTAQCSTASLTVGTHNITAVYAGDATNSGSTSGVLSQVVNKAASTTTVVTSLTPSTSGTNVTFTATITATSPTGTVNFKDGGSSIANCSAVAVGGIGNVRTAQCATAGLTVGTHNMTAVYSGDASNNGSTSGVLSQVVNAAASSPTTTTLTSSRNPMRLNRSVTFKATVTGGNPTGKVAFKNGGTVITNCGSVALSGLGNTKTASCVTSFATAGNYNIVATYGGDAANAGSSSAVLVETLRTR